jgi:hypothetical protein
MRLAQVTTLLLLLAGCAQHQIVNRYNPSANWNSDVYQCSQEAASAFPVIAATTQPNPTVSAIEQARLSPGQGLMYQAASAGQRAGAGLAQAINPDPNAANRQQHAARCLASKGWQREMIQR